ncbi:MAG: class II glutamine amidotransferase [Armatimonadota bacterium]
MCGLCGIIIGKMDRSQKQIDNITDMFTRLLLHSEHRGPFATGAASIGSDGQLSVVKQPVPAYRFVDSDEYRIWMKTITPNTTYLMGHTRWPTKGSIYNNENNHPLVTEIDVPGGGPGHGHILLTHNGSILQPESHFRRLGLSRTAQVDSELLLRIAQWHSDGNGLDINGFIDYLPHLHGRMSLATVVTSKPNEIILLKGNMPLEVRYNVKNNLIAYASEPGILHDALYEDQWQAVYVSAGEGLVVDSFNLLIINRFTHQFDKLHI